MMHTDNLTRRSFLGGATAAAVMQPSSLEDSIRKVQDSAQDSISILGLGNEVLYNLRLGNSLDSSQAENLLTETTKHFIKNLSKVLGKELSIETLPPNAQMIFNDEPRKPGEKAAAIVVDCAEQTVTAFRGNISDRHIFQFDGTTEKAGIFKGATASPDTDAHRYEKAMLAISADVYDDIMEQRMMKWIQQNLQAVPRNPDKKSIKPGIEL